MVRCRLRWCSALVCVVVPLRLLGPAAVHADSLLPLVTEQAQTLPSGVAEASIGVAYFDDLRFPAFTPPGVLRSQTLVKGPQLGFRIGAGGWAEIQAAYETIYLDEQATTGETNRQFGSGDVRLFTKVRLVHEGERFPGVALRFGAKLPNASRSARLGTDDTDFGIDGLASRSFGPVAAHINLGLLLLGNSGPTIGNSFQAGGQDDLVNYAVALTSAPLGASVAGATQLTVLGEFAGQTGSRFGNDRAAARLGLQLTRGAGTIYLGVSAGLVTASENLGASAGFSYRFEPGKLLSGE